MPKFRHLLLAGAVGLTALLSACGNSDNAGNTNGIPLWNGEFLFR